MKRFFALLLTLCLLFSGCETKPEAPAPAVPEDSDGLTVHFIDVGQADSILLQCDGENLLIDGGNVADSQLVVSYLLNQKVETLDYMICTHAHEDHVGGLAGVLAVIPTEQLWCPVTEYDSKCFRDFLYYADQQDLTPECPEPGSTYPLGSAEIQVLGPAAEFEEANDTSIIVKVVYGETSFLLSGDAEAPAEEAVLDAGYDLSCTVLKAGHHGSSTSNTYRWLREADADYAVISCGTDNSYGHPHEEVLSRFRDAGLEVYRTDLQGTVICHSDGKAVSFTTEKQAAVTNPTEYDGSGQEGHRPACYIGNKNSKKFHLPTCANLPKEENQVRFSTYEEAVAAGYTPCGSCLD